MTQSYIQIDNDLAADVSVEVAHSKKYLFRVLVIAACVGLTLYFWSKIPWSQIMPIKKCAELPEISYTCLRLNWKKKPRILSGTVLLP